MHREKGVLNSPCPTCGDERPAVTQPDGATAFRACESCYPAARSDDMPEVERAEAQTPSSPSADLTSLSRVTGDDDASEPDGETEEN